MGAKPAKLRGAGPRPHGSVAKRFLVARSRTDDRQICRLPRHGGGSLAWRGFITLEDWANEGAPLTLGCGRDIIEHCYGENRPGRGEWRIGDTRVDAATLACPTLAIASTSDAIVPAASTPPADTRIDLALGHVGMMIGSRAEEMLRTPLSAWIAEIGD